MFKFSSSTLAGLGEEGHYTHKQCQQACMVLYGYFYNLFGHRESDCAGNKNKKIRKGTIYLQNDQFADIELSPIYK